MVLFFFFLFRKFVSLLSVFRHGKVSTVKLLSRDYRLMRLKHEGAAWNVRNTIFCIAQWKLAFFPSFFSFPPFRRTALKRVIGSWICNLAKLITDRVYALNEPFHPIECLIFARWPIFFFPFFFILFYDPRNRSFEKVFRHIDSFV